MSPFTAREVATLRLPYRLVLELRLGIGDGHSYSRAAVARVLNRTEVWVRRVETVGLMRLWGRRLAGVRLWRPNPVRGRR